jgi:hypothetical protein
VRGHGDLLAGGDCSQKRRVVSSIRPIEGDLLLASRLPTLDSLYLFSASQAAEKIASSACFLPHRSPSACRVSHVFMSSPEVPRYKNIGDRPAGASFTDHFRIDEVQILIKVVSTYTLPRDSPYVL